MIIFYTNEVKKIMVAMDIMSDSVIKTFNFDK
jgi:hypothetical protein